MNRLESSSSDSTKDALRSLRHIVRLLTGCLQNACKECCSMSVCPMYPRLLFTHGI